MIVQQIFEKNRVQFSCSSPSKCTSPSTILSLHLHASQVANQAGDYPGFCSIKQLGVFLLSPGWDASPLQGYPHYWSLPVPIYTLGWKLERGTQRNGPSQDLNPDRSI